MKSKIDKRFIVDLGHDNDIQTRSRFDKEADEKIIGYDTAVLLLNSRGISKVYYLKEAKRFVVRLDWFGNETNLYYFDDLLYSLMYACLLTTCPTIDLFIEEFGTEDLVPFVSEQSSKRVLLRSGSGCRVGKTIAPNLTSISYRFRQSLLLEWRERQSCRIQAEKREFLRPY